MLFCKKKMFTYIPILRFIWLNYGKLSLTMNKINKYKIFLKLLLLLLQL